MPYGDTVPNPLYGLTRGRSRPNHPETDSRFALFNGGEALIAQGLPVNTALTSLGDSWSCQIATGSAFTHVANMPTTRAELALFNGEPDTGKCFVIDSAWHLCLTSLTAASGLSLIYQVAFVAALTDDAAQLINSPLGRSYGGRAKRAVAVTTMTANKWAALASGPTGPAASIGFGVFANVAGRIIVPPGATLGLNVVAGTAAGTGLIGVSWHEVMLPIN